MKPLPDYAPSVAQSKRMHRAKRLWDLIEVILIGFIVFAALWSMVV